MQSSAVNKIIGSYVHYRVVYLNNMTARKKIFNVRPYIPAIYHRVTSEYWKGIGLQWLTYILQDYNYEEDKNIKKCLELFA